MTENTKRIALLSFAVALVSVILLASSLANLQFHAGMPFPGGGNSPDASEPVTALGLGPRFASTIIKGIIDLILLILILSVPARLIPFVNVNRLLQVLLVVIALLLVANLISHLPGSQPAHFPGEPPEMSTTSSEYPVSPLGQPPQWIVWLVVTAVVLGAGVLAIKLWRQSQTPTSIEAQLSHEAEFAIHAIQGGESLRSVIVRCYLQMTRALQEERKIERSENMTVREFEDWLELKGFPRGPVHQLSRLFEKVRYSQQEITEEDETIALESLNEMVRFCQTQ